MFPNFLNNIRRGRPTPPAVVDEVRRRLARIGGSPLLQISRAQADGLEERLGVPVRVAARHFHPYIGDAVSESFGRGPRPSFRCR